MLRLLKILFLLILLLALALVIGYRVYKDTLFENARIWAAAELSEALQHPVDVGFVEYVPLQAFSLNDIVISEPEKKQIEIARIKKITLALDVFPLISKRKLTATIFLHDFKSKDIACNAVLRAKFHKADSYKKVFSPALLETVSIAGGKIQAGQLDLQNINGIVNFDNLKISKGKINFEYADLNALLDFRRIPRADTGYQVFLRSENIDLAGTLSKNENLLLIDKLKGALYNIQVDLKGEIKDFSLPERSIAITGTAGTNLEKLASFPGRSGSTVKSCDISGPARATFTLRANAQDIRDHELGAAISADWLKCKNIRADNVLGELLIKKGRLHVPSVKGSLYGGTISADLAVNLYEENLPFTFTVEIDNAEFGTALQAMTEKESSIYGNLDLDLSLKGYAVDPSSFTGNAEIEITEADLGPMPILTPLLGNIYAGMQNIFPGLKKINITAAGADLAIKDRKIMTDNLTLLGEEIFITAEGHMDFDGKLDFAVENHLIQKDPDKDESWQTSLRNLITGFGKLISKAHLRGTIEKPKWEFEYLNPIKDLITRNIRGFLGISE